MTDSETKTDKQHNDVTVGTDNNEYASVGKQGDTSQIYEDLATAVFKNLQPHIESGHSTLSELLNNQDALLSSLAEHNDRITSAPTTDDVKNLMDSIKTYRSKLVILKKDMRKLTERSANLRKRAVKLQQNRQKHEMQMLQYLERNLEREKELQAKVLQHRQPPALSKKQATASKIDESSSSQDTNLQ